MQRIPISLATAGMVLDQAVTRPDKPDGLPLYGKGNSLTESAIERMKQAGIESIIVVGRPIAQADEETFAESLANLEHRFRRVIDDPDMMQLKQLIAQQIKHFYGESA